MSHIIVSDNKSIGPLEQYPISPQKRSMVTSIKEEIDTVRTPGLNGNAGLNQNAGLNGNTGIAADAINPPTPLYKAKVEYLLDATEPREESGAKRRKVETLQSS